MVGRQLPSIKAPAYLPGPLDGQSTPRRLALRRPLAVIIENYYPDARPQYGLSQASTVIETLAEDGITRFMAIYLEHDAPKVGPIRSARMYFAHWAAAFHSILVHVGGNDDVLTLLWDLPKVFNIDENRWEVNLYDTGTNLFWRGTDRAAPHNMYANTKVLRQYAIKNHQDWAYTNAYFPHHKPAPLAQRGHGGYLTIDFENPLAPFNQPAYDVRYVYDRKSNTYLRYMGVTPHVDGATGKQLRPANVVVMHTGPAVADPNAGPTPGSILIPTIGHGKAQFFLNGKVIQGTWQQVNMYAPLRFYAHHHLVAFNPGQTWIEVVPPNSPVSWHFH